MQAALRLREVPLETPLVQGRLWVVLLRHLGADGRGHGDSGEARLPREAEVEGVHQQLLLRAQDARAFATVAHCTNALHKVHLCEDGPEVSSVDDGRHRRGMGVLQCLLVAEENVGGRAHGATVEELMQEALAVDTVRGAIRAKEPAEAKVRCLHPVRPTAGQVGGPTGVVQVQPGQAPSLPPQEVVGLLAVPRAVPKVHDVPGL
mmetsp:Transcript_53138/g.165073  ORF Transcript_53138/g.165073 Transcript_53138/m.165073 type:complete len:205 (-) Transcript_53138:390-1004(-)